MLPYDPLTQFLFVYSRCSVLQRVLALASEVANAEVTRKLAKNNAAALEKLVDAQSESERKCKELGEQLDVTRKGGWHERKEEGGERQVGCFGRK